MNWSNVKLILGREIRDQLRDRRTLFMIFVLPMLLYPLLGMSFVQISQFLEEQPTSVLIVGARNLDDLEDMPPLVDNRRFAADWFSEPERVRLLELHFAPTEPRGGAAEPVDPRAEARRAVQARQYDAAVYFPPDFADRLEAFRQLLRRRLEQAEEDNDEPSASWDIELKVSSPEIIYSTATERSQIAYARVSDVLRRWTERIGETNLAAGGVPPQAARPFDLQKADVADELGRRGTAVWSKVLPVLLLIWAMTGAFYPAIDLCAGEKERGTLETLLSSPAERSEIVLGKLGTIMLFSMVTAVLNLVSIGITGWLILSRLQKIGPPPTMAVVWLLIALVPVSALFSALCLALAAFARSTKEGQYYLMPLFLVTMPLVILPMASSVELNLGNSLIPIAGVVLLLRSMLEGSYWQALEFSLPVAAVTLGCCLLAIRWAVEQFNSEEVLFRESERLDVALRLRHLVRERGATPTVGAAIFCGVVILVIRFFMSFRLPQPTSFREFAGVAIVVQVVVIALPALLMTLIFTRSPRKTLLLERPRWLSLPAAAALAVVLHPAAHAVRAAVTWLYPVNPQIGEALEAMFHGAPFWQLVLIVAAVPAVCEELAFRGFILSGFRHLGHPWRAIIYSALLFGLSHALLQQSIVAFLLGVVIGFLAVESGSILPGMLFHLIHNSLAVLTMKITPQVLGRWPWLGSLIVPDDAGGLSFRWPAVALSTGLALAVLVWFHRLPHPISEEERRQEAMAGAWQVDA